MAEIKEIHGLAETPKPCDYFHMIAGTNSGGLIAILLGRLCMSTDEALREYDKCASKIFSWRNRKFWNLSHRFRARSVQAAVERIVKERDLGEHMRDPEEHEKGKVIVCVMPSDGVGGLRLIRSFAGDPGIDDDWDKHTMIWEAARAATASSSFFKPQELGCGMAARPYTDAAIGANNPVNFLLDEVLDEFGSGRKLGCLVSIGTGTREVKLGRAATSLGRFFSFPCFYWHLIKTLRATATDGEKTHRRLQARLTHSPGAYYRFNVPNGAQKIKPQAYRKITEVKSRTTTYLSDPAVTRQVGRLAEALQTHSFSHGLTLGLIDQLDKDQIFLANLQPTKTRSTSPFFTGRQDVMERLSSFFYARHTGGNPRREFLLHGMGGVGKTEIALQASEVLGDRFKYVFFLAGSTPSAISQSYSKICKQYNLGNGSVQSMQTLAMRWISELTDEWLLVFDDCNFSDQRHHLPRRGHGNIIYTTRSTVLKNHLAADCVLEVTPLGESDAVELLLMASGAQSTAPDTQDSVLATELVNELGCLPLAIDNAAASIRDGATLSTYLQDLRDRRASVLGDPRFQSKWTENPTVYAILEVSYETIMACKKRNGRQCTGRSARLALKVLGLLSFFHHESFPLLAMKRAADERRARPGGHPLGAIMDPPDSDFDNMLSFSRDGSWGDSVFVGLEFLESFSLVKWDRENNTVSMHILAHRWVQDRMDEDTFLRYSLLAKVILGDSIVLSRKWADIRFAQSLGPHALVCFQHPAKDFHEDGYSTQLKLKVAWQMGLTKEFRVAETLFIECIRAWEQSDGLNSPGVILTMQLLAALYRDMDRPGDARSTCLEVRWRILRRISDCEAAVEEPPTQGRPPVTFRRRRFTKTITQKLGQLRLLAENPFRALPGFHKRKEVSPCGCMANPSSAQPETVESKFADFPDDIHTWRVQYALTDADLAMVSLDQNNDEASKRMLQQAAKDLGELLPEDDVRRLQVENETKAFTDPCDLGFWSDRVKDWLDAAEAGQGDVRFQSEAGWQVILAHAECLLRNRLYTQAYQQFRAIYGLHEEVFGRYDRRVLKILRCMALCQVGRDEGEHGMQIAEACLRRARRAYGECHRETVLAMESLYEARFFGSFEDDEEGKRILKEAVLRAEKGLRLTHSITQRLQRRQRRAMANGESPEIPRVAARLRPAPAMDWPWEEQRAALKRLSMLTDSIISASTISQQSFGKMTQGGD